MTIHEITKQLNGVKRSQTGFIAVCPAHDDKKRSLSVGESSGKVLLNCFAGCPPEKIVDALGIEFKDLFDGSNAPSKIESRSTHRPHFSYSAPPKAKIACVYRYTDASGVLLYENVRFDPKGFGQRRHLPDGTFVWNLTGVPRVPYRLPELVNKVRHGSDIWLCEGEKDADTLAELGFIASSFKNWSRQFNKYIDKTNVVIVRDHDLPGGVQADEAARLVVGATASVKVLDVHAEYEMPEKNGPDISDYVRQCVQDEGMTREEIAERLSLMVDGQMRWVDRNTSTANLFIVKSGNQWLEDARKRPSPKMLFGEFWFQGELCILFADTNVGKSILAVQIGDAIARGRQQSAVSSQPEEKADCRVLTTDCPPLKVVYFDFELTDKQFESRLSKRVEGEDAYVEHYEFNDNFSRAEVDPETSELYGFKTFEEFLNYSLDRVIREQNADVLIIDNLTYLKDETENARNALPLMKYLKELKSRHGISILALAHTPKRDSAKPLGRNDLQGSKMLINFCDSSFTIGESHKETGVRYLKQIKARNTAIIYHAENVLLCTIEKVGSLLQFTFTGTGSEREHLRPQSEKDKGELKKQVREMSDEGVSAVRSRTPSAYRTRPSVATSRNSQMTAHL